MHGGIGQIASLRQLIGDRRRQDAPALRDDLAGDLRGARMIDLDGRRPSSTAP